MASLRRADIPVDGNGTTRNITRSVSPHQLHLAASEARDFAWVLHALWGGNKDGVRLSRGARRSSSAVW